ncbi:unnamed protein product [Urochloa humidicola]
MEVSRATMLLVVAAAVVAVLSATASTAEDPSSTPGDVTTPVAHTPVGSFEGADGPVADITEDKDAGSVGSPIGTTMTEPRAAPAPPGAPSSATMLVGGSAAAIAAAVAVVAAGVFAF